MKVNDVFWALFVCAILAAAVIPTEVRAEYAASERQLTAQRCVALWNKLGSILEKFKDFESFSSSRTSNQTLSRAAGIFKKTASEMYAAISQSDVPEEVRNAALEFAQATSNVGNVLSSAPYIPEDEGEAFLIGFFRGMGGDITGGMGEIEAWQRRGREAVEEYLRKFEALKVIMIKYGVKFE